MSDSDLIDDSLRRAFADAGETEGNGLHQVVVVATTRRRRQRLARAAGAIAGIVVIGAATFAIATRDSGPDNIRIGGSTPTTAAPHAGRDSLQFREV
ncbi:MAG TPA: hypothetical protein VGP92_01630, partial [Acidimicrobiia bacterium]|nr:hypothetical protein [Acidimicrobiia bacterium]